MTLKVVAIVETKYHESVIKNSSLSCTFIRLNTTKNLSRFYEILSVIYSSDIVIISDFRSARPFIYMLLSVILRKKIVLSDDGLVSHNLDKNNYSFSSLNDGTVGKFKLIILSFFLKYISTFDRISAYPNYTKSLGKIVLNKVSEKSRFTNIEKVNKMLFIGQNPITMGLLPKDYLQILDDIALKFKHLDLYYSPHPTFMPESILDPWNVIGPSSSIKKNDFSHVSSINSTGCIDFGLSGSKCFFPSLNNVSFKKDSLINSHTDSQDTIINILNCYNNRIIKTGPHHD